MVLPIGVLGFSGVSASEDLVHRPLPLSGGPSQVLMTTRGLFDYRCARAPATLCAFGERSDDQKQLVITAFDPVKGRGRELARIATKPGFNYDWDLSPDGSWIAASFPAGENRIRLIPLAGGSPRDLAVNGWFDFVAGPDFAPDGKGFYAGSSSPRDATVLCVNLQGQATPLWEQKGSFQTWCRESPDARHLAIMSYAVDSNAWMLEGF